MYLKSQDSQDGGTNASGLMDSLLKASWIERLLSTSTNLLDQGIMLLENAKALR